jgi:hypothetical protein
MPFTAHIYRIDFPDGYFYIGNTKHSLDKRLQAHKNWWLKIIKLNTEVGYISKSPFEIYLRKNGWNNPTITSILECQCYDKEEKENLEFIMIRKFFYHPKNLNTVCKNEPRKDKRTKKNSLPIV